MQYFLILFALAVTPFVLVHFVRARRRERLLATPLSPDARARVHALVPLTRRLPPKLAARLEGQINRFLWQVQFIGCEGLEIDEDMRLSIAAQACLLTLGRAFWFDNLRTILIYPGAFRSRMQSQSGFVVTEQDVIRLGESWGHGRVVLSWEHAQSGAGDPGDGVNVVIHEFAHQIDDLTGNTDGVPLLGADQAFSEWEAVFLRAYNTHVRRIERGAQTVIDPYGATAHEEFFAVVVELFFERPDALRADEPDVYEQLRRLFALDPGTWH